MPTSSRIGPVSAATLLGLATTALAAGEPAAAERVFQWRPFLAPFHNVVLHFPIGFLAMVCVLELWRMLRPSEELKAVLKLTLWLSLLSGLAAAGLGILRATGGGYQAGELEAHRWTGLAVVTATLATLATQHLAWRPGARRTATHAYRGCLALTLGLLTAAGHLGGNLTHGSNYLTKNAPPFVRDLLEGDWSNGEESDPGTPRDEKTRFYLDHVQPILEHRCIRCHGATKQKGGYRLDDPTIALAGGESGKPAIVPGEPMASELVRLILLPPEDDEVMPPEGKEPLTAEETLTIIRWIQAGAAFPTAQRATAAAGGGSAGQ
jgi:uncharacterized membrane protein